MTRVTQPAAVALLLLLAVALTTTTGCADRPRIPVCDRLRWDVPNDLEPDAGDMTRYRRAAEDDLGGGKREVVVGLLGTRTRENLLLLDLCVDADDEQLAIAVNAVNRAGLDFQNDPPTFISVQRPADVRFCRPQDVKVPAGVLAEPRSFVRETLVQANGRTSVVVTVPLLVRSGLIEQPEVIALPPVSEQVQRRLYSAALRVRLWNMPKATASVSPSAGAYGRAK